MPAHLRGLGMPVLKAVFCDVGGPIYDDNNFLTALTSATRDLAAEAGFALPTSEQVRAVYDLVRNTEGISIRTSIAREFLGSDERSAALHDQTRRYWFHPEGSLYPDAKEFLNQIHPLVTVGVLANQEAETKNALVRDGLEDVIDVWGLSALVGHEKPSREFFQWALDQAGVEPGEALHIGNRYDTDVAPALAMGMKTAWVLRGEAPDVPDPHQLAEAHYVLQSLIGFGDVIAELAQGGAY